MIHRPNVYIVGKIVGAVLVGGALVINLGCSALETRPSAIDQRDQLKERVDRVIANGELDPVPATTTRFSESELNSILNGQIADWIPNGLSEPQVRLLGNDRFSLRVIVDIDEFKRRRKRPQSAGPLNFFSGKLPALVRGELISSDGKGQFKLQSTEVNGIPLPPALALELLSTHTKTRRRPEGFDIQKPFDLPVKIRQLQITPNELVVIQ
ncbi:MAG TPA: hypothetical protein VFK65_26495 [Candidatus Binatia bacterium]|nr:hypothetical protein [Candidatus Binatia bacterium]